MKTFKTRVLGLLAALGILGGGYAIAQVTLPNPVSMGVNDVVQVIPNAAPTAGNVYATLNQFKAWVLGGSTAHNAVPVLSACGTSPAIATGSTDLSGRVTTGTGTPTGCVVTFASAFTATPSCAVVSQTAPATTTPAYTVSTTAITIVQAAGDSRIYNYICSAMQGG